MKSFLWSPDVKYAGIMSWSLWQSYRAVWSCDLAICPGYECKVQIAEITYSIDQFQVENWEPQWHSQGLPGWVTYLEGQTEDKNQERLQKNKKKWWKFEEKWNSCPPRTVRLTTSWLICNPIEHVGTSSSRLLANLRHTSALGGAKHLAAPGNWVESTEEPGKGGGT